MKGRNRLLGIGGLVCVLVLGVFLSACGSGGSSTSAEPTSESTSGSEGGEAKPAASEESSGVSSAAFEEFSAPITWPGPNTPVTPPPGKSITVIICGSQGHSARP